MEALSSMTDQDRDHGLNKMDQSPEERAETIKRAENKKRAGIGQPGIESASGRDRSQGEFPRQAGTNVNDVDLSGALPSSASDEPKQK
jgi:hypothetical protein